MLRQLKNIHTLFYILFYIPKWFAAGAGVAMFCGFLSTALR